MLVLARKNGEAVLIDGVIRVKVLSVQGSRVKLGFEAPGDVSIQREEIVCRVPVARGTAAGATQRVPATSAPQGNPRSLTQGFPYFPLQRGLRKSRHLPGSVCPCGSLGVSWCNSPPAGLTILTGAICGV